MIIFLKSSSRSKSWSQEGSRTASRFAIQVDRVRRSIKCSQEVSGTASCFATQVNRTVEETPASMETDRLRTSHACTKDTAGEAAAAPIHKRRSASDRCFKGQYINNNKNNNTAEEQDIVLDISLSYHRWITTPVAERPAIKKPDEVSRRRLTQITQRVNRLLAHVWEPIGQGREATLTELNCIAYVAGQYVSTVCNPPNSTHSANGDGMPASNAGTERPGWQVRLEKQVASLRTEVSRLTSMTLRPSPAHARLWRKYKIRDIDDARAMLEQRKAQLLATAGRLRSHIQHSQMIKARKCFRTMNATSTGCFRAAV